MFNGILKKILIVFVPGLVLACAGGTALQTSIATTSPAETSQPSQLPVVNSPQLTQFHFFNENDGWGVTESQIVRTNDGGINWFDATPGGSTQLGYAPFEFLDSQTLWMVLPSQDFQSGTLYHTTDGGVTWQSQPVPFSFANLQFLDAFHGFALAALGAGAGSEAVALYTTTDGGLTWNRIFINDPNVSGSNDSLPLGGQKYGFTFLDSSRGWVGGSIPMDDYIYLYRTTDGGSTWSEVGLALPAGSESAQTGNAGPSFFSATDGVLVVNLVMPGDPGLAVLVYRTNDGGETWFPGQVIPSARQTQFSSFLDGYSWGDGMFYITHDAGQSWSSITPGEDFTAMLSSFQFMNPQTGWVLTTNEASDPSFYRTTDGGSTWTLLIP